MTNRRLLGLVHMPTSFYLEFSERVILIINFFDVQNSPVQPLSRRQEINRLKIIGSQRHSTIQKEITPDMVKLGEKPTNKQKSSGGKYKYE